MTILYAAAGLAEAAWVFGLMACWTALFFIAGVDIVACKHRSWKLSLTAIVLLLLFSWMFSPWTAFEPIRSDSGSVDDADVAFWSARFRSMAIMWCIEAVLTCTLLPVICALEGRRRRRGPGGESQEDAEHTMSPKTKSRLLVDGFLTFLLLAVGSLVLGMLFGI